MLIYNKLHTQYLQLLQYIILHFFQIPRKHFLRNGFAIFFLTPFKILEALGPTDLNILYLTKRYTDS